MYIAQDHTLNSTEQRLYNLYVATYPTDQTKFRAHLMLTAAKDRNEQTLKQLFHENTVARIALHKIVNSAGKTRKGQFHDHDWCRQIAQEAITATNPTNTKED